MSTHLDDPYTLVARFLNRHHLLLPAKNVHEWRIVPAGTYTHNVLPYGPMTDGITNGVIAFFYSDIRGIVEVHLGNLTFKAAPANKYSPPKAKKTPKKGATTLTKVPKPTIGMSLL